MIDNLYEEYQSFRSSVLLKKVALSDSSKVWSYFEVGPKTVKCPLIFLPPLCGEADVYFRQMLSLSSRGFYSISVDYPPYWDIESFCFDFYEFLNFKQFDKVHIFGTSLGGYMAQRFAEYCTPQSTAVALQQAFDENHNEHFLKQHIFKRQRVASLILCSSFTNTNVFRRDDFASICWMLPAFVLRAIVSANFHGEHDQETAVSNNFMLERLAFLNKEQLASRITLNCRKSKCKTSKISHLPITVIDVFEKSVQNSEIKTHLLKAYPNAKRAYIKSGENFLFLSRSNEINMHILVHLQAFQRTPYTAKSDD